MGWKSIAEFAPIATAMIAFVAAITGYFAIQAQQQIARRRAAVDCFLKTEIDPYAVGLYHKFRAAVLTMQEFADQPNVELHKDFRDLRGFLDICELIAVGIKEKAFSERISFEFWGHVLPQTLKDARPLIDRIRKIPGEGSKDTYCDLEDLCERWAKKPPVH